MASLHFIQVFLFCISLLVLIALSWVAFSGTGLSSRIVYGERACDCEREMEGSVQSRLKDASLMFVGKDSELSANNLAECKKKMRTYKERLDWEISRSDWRNNDVEVSSQEGKVCDDMKKIEIIVNRKRSINGLSTKEDIFVPFSAVKKEFEIQGGYNDQGVFEWRNAMIRTWEVPKNYNPTGPYVGLENSFVENRKRVKCIDGMYGVPVTTQWDRNGYYYAIQIAQYGLAHYSKFLRVGTNKRKTVLHLGKSAQSLPGSGKVKVAYSKEKGRNVTYFNGKVAFHKTMPANQTRRQNILSLDVEMDPGSEIIVSIRKGTSGTFYIKYVEGGDEFISCSHQNVQIRIGHVNGWRKLTRDLENDLIKGIATCKNFKGKAPNFDGLQRVTIIGSGHVGAVAVSTSAHDEMFLNAAQWLLKFQDEDGGWPVNVTRKIIPQVVSPPGWRSAMGSGQAISLFCRVYSYTKQSKYLEAAVRALRLFNTPVSENGFVSTVMGNLKMFEEYPSEPSLHVLNGFIFSLIGLYDLSRVEQDSKVAKGLFDVGIKTLLRILPMYDNGRGTFYDLRHVVLPGVEPKRARWDYHAVHLGQLQLLKVITGESVIDQILTRWKGYADGVPARHN